MADNTVRLKVWGEFACFTRPDLKVKFPHDIGEIPITGWEFLPIALMTRFGVSRTAAAIRVEELQIGVGEEGLW